jgi:hypothetical protein
VLPDEIPAVVPMFQGTVKSMALVSIAYHVTGSVPAKCCHTFGVVVCIGVGLLVTYLYCDMTL